MLLGYPLAPDSAWDRTFLAGLDEALGRFACPLLGGDTVSPPAGTPRSFALTALGRSAHAPSRAGAAAGDCLWVTGCIGDAGAGLAIAQGQTGPEELLARYRRPVPRLDEGQAVATHAHAMMDVSDGLLIDAQRMAAASGVAVEIDLARLPLSDAYARHAGTGIDARIAAATAGDDYELLFALEPRAHPPFAATRIGTFTPGAGLRLTAGSIAVPLPERLGFEHG